MTNVQTPVAAFGRGLREIDAVPTGQRLLFPSTKTNTRVTGNPLLFQPQTYSDSSPSSAVRQHHHHRHQQQFPEAQNRSTWQNHTGHSNPETFLAFGNSLKSGEGSVIDFAGGVEQQQGQRRGRSRGREKGIADRGSDRGRRGSLRGRRRGNGEVSGIEISRQHTRGLPQQQIQQLQPQWQQQQRRAQVSSPSRAASNSVRGIEGGKVLAHRSTSDSTSGTGWITSVFGAFGVDRKSQSAAVVPGGTGHNTSASGSEFRSVKSINSGTNHNTITTSTSYHNSATNIVGNKTGAINGYKATAIGDKQALPISRSSYENHAHRGLNSTFSICNLSATQTGGAMEGQQTSGNRGGGLRGRGRGSREGSEGAGGRGRGRGRGTDRGTERGLRGTRLGGRGRGSRGDMSGKADSNAGVEAVQTNGFTLGEYESDGATPPSLFINDGHEDMDSGMESEREMSKEDRAVRFSEGTFAHNKLAKLKAAREKERADLIRRGIIDDPNNRKPLSEALTFIGTCMDMCPLFEREERQFQKNVDKLEIDPQTGLIDSKRAVKAFHRPAAGNEAALPSDVRPPKVLVKTLDYLIREIVGGSESLMSTHGFVRDRTRGIRQDFTLQNYRGPETIECHERIARYHILCIHLLAQDDRFVLQQEMEQLQKTMTTLNELYDDAKKDGIACPNEPEFRAYQILIYLHDMEFERVAQRWPFMNTDPGVQQALRLHQAAFKNAPRFFNLLRRPETTYMMACIAEAHFYNVRKEHFRKMRQAYNKDTTGVTLSDIARQLGFDHKSDLDRYCEHFGLETAVDNQGSEYIIPNRNFDDSRPQLRPTCNQRIVEVKRQNRVIPDIINAIHGSQARVKAGPFQEDEGSDAESGGPRKIQSWVPDDEEESTESQRPWDELQAYEVPKITRFNAQAQEFQPKRTTAEQGNVSGAFQANAFGRQQKQVPANFSQQSNVFRQQSNTFQQQTASPSGGSQQQAPATSQPPSAFQQAITAFSKPGGTFQSPTSSQQASSVFSKPPPPAFANPPNAFAGASAFAPTPSPFGSNMQAAFGGSFGRPSVSPAPQESTQPSPFGSRNASPNNLAPAFQKPAQRSDSLQVPSGTQFGEANIDWQSDGQYEGHEGPEGEEQYTEYHGGEDEDDEYAAKQADLARRQEEVAQRQREIASQLEEFQRRIAEKEAEQQRKKESKDSELRQQLLKHRMESQVAQHQFNRQQIQQQQQLQESIFAQKPQSIFDQQPKAPPVFNFSIPSAPAPAPANAFAASSTASQDAFKMPQPSPGFSISIASNLEQMATSSTSDAVVLHPMDSTATKEVPEPAPEQPQLEDPAILLKRFSIYVKTRMRNMCQAPNPQIRKNIIMELQSDLIDGLESQEGMGECRDILADHLCNAKLAYYALTLWRKYTAAKVRKAKMAALRAEKRRSLAAKEKSLGTQEDQWVPVKIKIRPGQDLVEQGNLFRDLNFGPVPLNDIFAAPLQKAFANRGLTNTNFSMLVLNAEPKAEYWWLRKFGVSSGLGIGVKPSEMKLKNGNRFTVERIMQEPSPPADVGALVYGCRADYSISNEERFRLDRDDLHLAMDYALRESKYEKLAVMVICYRSPLDDCDVDPYGEDVERTSGEGRRRRLKAIRKALELTNTFPGAERIIAKDIVLIEMLEDTNLLRPFRKFAKFVAGAVGGKPKEEVNGVQLEDYEDVVVNGNANKAQPPPSSSQQHQQRLSGKRSISATGLQGNSPVDNKKVLARSSYPSSPGAAARALRESISSITSTGDKDTPGTAILANSLNSRSSQKSSSGSPPDRTKSATSKKLFNVQKVGLASDYFILKSHGIDLSDSLTWPNGKKHHSEEPQLSTSGRRKLPVLTRSLVSDALNETISGSILANSVSKKRSWSATSDQHPSPPAPGMSPPLSSQQHHHAGVKYYDYDADARRNKRPSLSPPAHGLEDGMATSRSLSTPVYDIDNDPVVMEARRIREAPEYHPELEFPELAMLDDRDGHYSQGW